MIVDCHVHTRAEFPPGYERTELEVLEGEPWPIDRLLEATDAVGIDRVFQTTPGIIGYDNSYSFEAAAKRPDRVIGVLGYFDITQPRLEERLEALMTTLSMSGVRITMEEPEKEEWVTDGKLDAFLDLAPKYSPHVGIYLPDPKALADVARRHPDVTITADHSTFTLFMTNEQWDRHWAHLPELGREPNVWLKTTLFPESAPPGEKFPFPTSRERFRHLYEEVGGERMIWGSHFPNCHRACTLPQSLEFFKSLDFIGSDELPNIMGGTLLALLERTRPS